ncbi:biopolymer transporter ExbD [Alcanivorax sp.]|jgi:biopolymer transport protein ExbD|uniref:ExbD/TolR family protein n=1 Tax=Alcanivorax sp. TaxID=1872427 RepID=UPI000C4BD121|nr:biopolymer transporter ExbD [Alcanivorax sp.]MBQ24427.1 biopolymer transporter ExbD [Alcanivorax sp.]|tara:strand:- start:307 stop:837 length:531 start_codon:yes stop_codon:yes gene_type:complete
MRFRRRRSHDTEVELNITAFLNLMVVLIPFLLINAVFAQVSILQLDLPAVNDSSTPSEDDEKDKLVLEVLIYGNRYEVVDRNTSAVLKIVKNDGEKPNSTGLHDYLVKVKEKFPQETAITLLCEDDTPYEVMIQTMDAVRLYNSEVNGQTIKKELFPSISIGSAPKDQSAGQGGDA